MLRMDTPALEKGGYTLGLVPIAFRDTRATPWCHYPSLFKGGGPSVRMVVG